MIVSLLAALTAPLSVSDKDLHMPRSKGMVIGFWIATALFCLQMSFTAYAQLRLPQVAAAFAGDCLTLLERPTTTIAMAPLRKLPPLGRRSHRAEKPLDGTSRLF